MAHNVEMVPHILLEAKERFTRYVRAVLATLSARDYAEQIIKEHIDREQVLLENRFGFGASRIDVPLSQRLPASVCQRIESIAATFQARAAKTAICNS